MEKAKPYTAVSSAQCYGFRWEPDESRGSRPVLRGPRGEIPRGYLPFGRCQVEPVADATVARRQRSVTQPVRMLGSAGSTRIRARGDREWLAGLRRDDAGELPVPTRNPSALILQLDTGIAA